MATIKLNELEESLLAEPDDYVHLRTTTQDYKIKVSNVKSGFGITGADVIITSPPDNIPDATNVAMLAHEVGLLKESSGISDYPPLRSITRVTGYTLSTSDMNRMSELVGSEDIDIIVPTGIPKWGTDQPFITHIRNRGTGIVTIIPNTTVYPPAGGALTIPQHGTVSIQQSDSDINVYFVYGQVNSA